MSRLLGPAKTVPHHLVGAQHLVLEHSSAVPLKRNTTERRKSELHASLYARKACEQQAAFLKVQ